MATSKRQRAFAMFAALLFFISSLGFTGAVLFSMYKQGKMPKQETMENTQLKGTALANFTPVKNVAKLEKIDIKPGTGAEAKASSNVTVHYTGAVAATGKIFESSLDSGQPVPLGLNQVIKGWAQGIPGMKVGGTRRLVIPAKLAYGKNSPSPDIPANADLVFDVELIAVQ